MARQSTSNRGPRLEGTRVVWTLGAGPRQIRAIAQATALFAVVMTVSLAVGFWVEPLLGVAVLALAILGLVPIVVGLGSLALDWPRNLRVELHSDRLEIDQWWAETVHLEDIARISETHWPSPAVILHLEDGWWVRIPLGDRSRRADFAAVRVPIAAARARYVAFLEGRERILPPP